MKSNGTLAVSRSSARAEDAPPRTIAAANTLQIVTFIFLPITIHSLSQNAGFNGVDGGAVTKLRHTDERMMAWALFRIRMHPCLINRARTRESSVGRSVRSEARRRSPAP